jgi:hypothetical protein
MTDKPSYTDASRPYLAPRLVREASDAQNTTTENAPLSLESFRDAPAWVLLGEPGAGKSTAFKAEAEATGGTYLSIADFVVDDDLDDDWRGKILFLDGLDEVRAGGDTLRKVRNKLKKLGKPAFRLSCRAADWYGATDQEVIEAAATDGKIAVLLLQPLGDGDVLDILRENHSIANPKNFVKEAQKRGIDGLLNNPQTLEFLAKKVQWSSTKKDIYELACKILVDENNVYYQVKQISEPVDVESRLDAAGQLCNGLLDPKIKGISRLLSNAQEDFPYFRDFSPLAPAVASQVLSSALFCPVNEKHLKPVNPSIAAFLVARCWGQKIDQQGLPLKRALSSLFGDDKRAVEKRRGLYAWLAVECKRTRKRLIRDDPFTVLMYGDVSPMSIADKRMILQGLKQEPERSTDYRKLYPFSWRTQFAYPFGALSAEELIPDFIDALKELISDFKGLIPDRSDALTEPSKAAQSFADCVLDILIEGKSLLEGKELSELRHIIKKVILNTKRSDTVRGYAALAWLNLHATPIAVRGLLGNITKDKKADQRGDLAAILLDHLYPSRISLKILLGYARDARCANTFWENEFLTKAPPEHLPALLDQLVQRTISAFPSVTISRLLQRTIELHGEQTTDEKLFAWLWVGVEQGNNEEREGIASWLEAHPDRYKALLALCYQDCKRSAEIYGRNQSSKQRRSIFDQNSENLAEPISWLNGCKRPLYEAAVPEDLGLWHLKQISQTDDEKLAKNHLACAFELLNQRGGKYLTLEVLEAWGIEYPERQSWLDTLLFCEIPESRKEQVARDHAVREERADVKRDDSLYLNQNKAEIHSGQFGEMFDLALIWKGEGKYRNLVGKTPAERFNDLCDNGDEILEVAEMGFRACVVRTDLPTVDEIIALHTQQQGHWAQMPCLIGMDLRWQDNPSATHALQDDVLCKMIAFELIFNARNIPAWFSKLVKDEPALVADVLKPYAIAILNSEQDGDYDICFLADKSYREVAPLVVPTLLERFPLCVRANSGLSLWKSQHLQNLQSLLVAARRYDMPELPAIVKKKATRIEDMDDDQKIYWLAAAMLLDPVHHQAALWEYVGADSARISNLYQCVNGQIDLTHLPADVLERLIELFLPDAELGHPSGAFGTNEPIRRGNYVCQLIVARLGGLGTDQAVQKLKELLPPRHFQSQAVLDQLIFARLSGLNTDQKEQELEKLLKLPDFSQLKPRLQNELNQVERIQREREFKPRSPEEVAQILANKAPASSADLAALALDYLDGIAQKIRYENDDYFRHFWTTDKTTDKQHQNENTCRDLLLTRLREAFNSLNVDCQPEADYANDKRADIRLSYQNQFEVPIEVKGEWHPQLWKAAQSQLVQQYSIAPNANGYGIYLVLWFGGKGMPNANDGRKKPTSPEELKTRLEAQLNRERIFIRVLDVTYPNQPV